MKAKSFADLDANYKSKDSSGREWEWHDAYAAPFALDGFPYIEDGKRSRLPLKVARQCAKEGVYPMSQQCAGAVISFRSNSPAIALKATFNEIYRGYILSASCGFDLYKGRGSAKRFLGNRYIAAEGIEVFDAAFDKVSTDGETHDYSLYLPLHCAIKSIHLGFAPGSSISKPTAYAVKKPIVFYGSSITNCAAVGRPGMAYPAQIGRILDASTHNIGLSGSCLGELPVAEEIAKLDLSVLVLEYDHNAPDSEFLRKTHAPFFKRFRELRPDIPVLMMSACNLNDEELRRRRDIIMETYLAARKSGDTLVDFLDGETLFAGYAHEDCTTDTCHPNDIGCQLMAERIADRLRKWLV